MSTGQQEFLAESRDHESAVRDHDERLDLRRYGEGVSARLYVQRLYPDLFTVCPDCGGSGGCLLCGSTGLVSLGTARERAKESAA